MTELKGFQKKYLRGLAHHLDPVVYIGKQGVSSAILEKLEQELECHELIKVKFMEFKDAKKELIIEIADKSQSHIVGMIGHNGLLYRMHEDVEKRKIELPVK